MQTVDANFCVLLLIDCKLQFVIFWKEVIEIHQVLLSSNDSKKVKNHRSNPMAFNAFSMFLLQKRMKSQPLSH